MSASAKRIPPEPVEDVVVLTMDAETARILKRWVGTNGDVSRAFMRDRNPLLARFSDEAIAKATNDVLYALAEAL